MSLLRNRAGGLAAPIACCLISIAALGVLPAYAAPRTVETRSGPIEVETLVEGLDHPWGLAFLPDGRMLVTERPGRLRIVTSDRRISPPLGGVPAVYANRQGGLLDVAVAPDFATSRMVYVSYAEPGDGGASTAVARGRLGERDLEGTEVIFRQQPKVDGGGHFGSRLAFAPDGTLFVTTGERFKFAPAQDLGGHLGKVVRINPDGSVPRDNPFRGRTDVRPEIWSYGHRNVQAAAINPASGKLWIAEHGPKGGDEINVPDAGKNYGWPLVSWGRHYNGEAIPLPTSRPDLAPSIHQWTPVIAASGMAFYTGDVFPGWRGSLLVGGLTAESVVRLTLDGEKVTDEERIPIGSRVRDVRQGPDGCVYVLTDESDGTLLRLSPASTAQR